MVKVHEEEALSVEGNRTNKREGWPETKRKGCEAPTALTASVDAQERKCEDYARTQPTKRTTFAQ
jgi:hypothetical protein